MPDDADQFAQLKSVLTSHDQVKRRLNNLRTEALQSALGEPGPEIRRVAAGELHPQECPAVLRAFECARAALEAVFAEDVLAKLDRPPIVTNGDLVHAFLEHLVVGDGEYEQAYPGFVRSVVASVRMVGSQPFSIAVSAEHLDDKPLRKVLWQNRVASIAMTGSGPAGAEPGLGTSDPSDRSVIAYARANVFGTAAAAASLERKASPLLRSLVYSFAQLTLPHGEPALRGELPCVHNSDLTSHMARIGECLEIYFGRSAKGDSVDGRLRNAMLLLCEADRQKHFAIAVSLCFSAMEAMLSPGPGDIVQTLSRNVATLLEPPNANRTAAIRLVKELYNVRSKVLHGAALDFDPKTIHRCRFLAAAVLRAFLERRAYVLKASGKVEDPAEFFDSIQNAQMNGKSVDGVSDSPARRLWEVAS